MGVVDELYKRMKQQWQYTGQVPAGLLQATVANTADAQDIVDHERLRTARGETVLGQLANATDLTGSYRPAIMDAPGAIYGVIKTLASGEAVDPQSFGGRAMSRTNAGIERVNNALGITDPQNAMQQALNIGGSIIVPGPKLPTAATKLGKAAQIGAELALPLRQTGLKTAAVASTAVGVPIREGIDALADDPNYNSIAEGFAGYDKTADGKTVPTFNITGDSEFPDDLTAQEFPDNLNTNGEFPDDLSDTVQAPASDLNASNEPMSTGEKALLGGLALITAGLGATFARKSIQSIRGVPNASELTGTRTVMSGAGAKDKAVGAILQADQVARTTADEFFTPDNAKLFKYNSDIQNNSAVGAKINHATQTGELPGTAVKAPPLANLLQAVAKDLDETEFGMVTDALLAKSALDDINTTGVQSAFNDKTPTELKQMADLVDNDPKLSKYAAGVRQQYSALLDFMNARGLISNDAIAEWRKNRPNYVHMSRDVELEGGISPLEGGRTSTVVDELFKRADEEWGGVQTGATRNPVDELAGRYASLIQLAEKNTHRKMFVDNLMNSRGANELVPTTDGSRIKLISKAKEDGESVVKVMNDGVTEYYKIGDPALYRALQYAPRATMPVLGQMRQVAQFFTTGAGNVTSMFGATVSPVYDTLTGMVLKPNGIDLGVINETLNRVGSKYNLGRLDPTVLASAPIGALRRSFDGLTQSLATNLSDQLIRQHGWVLESLGPQKTEALRDYLQGAYDTSIRAMMDRTGTSSHLAYGADNSRNVPTSLHTIAPDYYSDMQKRLVQQARNGDFGRYQGMLSAGKSVFGQARASSIARMYSAVLQNMQEGFRYQAMATNASKVKSQADMAELASKVRRISVDSAQHGGNDTWNRIADSVMYANLGTQAIGEWGKRFAKSPATTSANLLTTLGMLTALRYGAIFNDPDAAQRTQEKTDMQNTASITTFGGAEIPVEPMLRMVTGPMFAFLDQVSGVADGNPDPNFVAAISRYFDDGSKEQQEAVAQSMKDSFSAGLQGASPMQLSGVPLANVAMAASGVDPSMTRITGEAALQRPQQSDPFGGDGKYSDSLLNTSWEKMIEAASGTGLTNLINVADQYQRAAYARNADGSRAVSPEGAVRVALSAMTDAQSKTKGPVQGVLFSGYEHLNSIGDTDYKLYQSKTKGLEKANQIFRQDILQPYLTGSDPRTAMVRPIDIVKPDYANTPLAPIGAATVELMKQLRPLQNRSGQLSKAIEEVRTGQKTTTVEDRNKQINELNEERRYLFTLMLRAQRITEEQITDIVGKPFTYQDFDPQEFMGQPQQ